MPTATPELFNTVLAQTIPRAADMGIEVVELRPGYVKSKTPFEGNGNHIGTMYAGRPLHRRRAPGRSDRPVHLRHDEVLSRRQGPLDQLPPARHRRRLRRSLDVRRARAELAEKAAAEGKAEFIFETTLTDEAGEVVATTEGTYQLRAHGG